MIWFSATILSIAPVHSLVTTATWAEAALQLYHSEWSSPWPWQGRPSFSKMVPLSQVKADDGLVCWQGCHSSGLARSESGPQPNRKPLDSIQETALQQVQVSQEPGITGRQHEEVLADSWLGQRNALQPLWLNGEEDRKCAGSWGRSHPILY